jgi:hypothetical protein
MTSSLQQQKLLTLLRELFQLNQPDLDFGLYLIKIGADRTITSYG